MKSAVTVTAIVLFSVLLENVGHASADAPMLSRPRAAYVLRYREFSPSMDPSAVHLAATPSIVLLSSDTYCAERILAFDRVTGRELWTLPRDPRRQDDRADATDRWTLVGVAVSPGGQQLAVLHRLANGSQNPTPDAVVERPSGELVGADARTGKYLWHLVLPAPAPPQTAASVSLLGSVVLLTSRTQGANRTNRTKRNEDAWSTEAIDAFTGQSVQPPLPGRSLALIQTPAFHPVILSPDTLSSVTLPIFSGFGIGPSGAPVASTGTRAIVLVTTDDDGAGHSVWPRYLYCAAPNGQKAWQYPEKLVFPGSDHARDWKHYESVVMAEYVPRAGIVTLTSSRGELVGVAIVNGKALWRRPTGNMQILSMPAYGKGCFVLVGSASPFPPAGADNWVGFVSAHTGKLRRVARLPGARRLWVDGSESFAFMVAPSTSGSPAAGLSVQSFRIGDPVTAMPNRQLTRAPRHGESP
jgi:outer membrane protein assembly factor BamB